MNDQERNRRVEELLSQEQAFLQLASQVDHRCYKTFCPAGSPNFIKTGSYHACIFLELDEANMAPEKYVIRMPLECPDVSQLQLVKEIMEGAILSMRLVSEKTKIPVPKVRHYDVFNGNAIASPYMMLTYHEGQTLADIFRSRGKEGVPWQKLYQQCLHIWTELQQVTFPKIGSLALPEATSCGCLECDVNDIIVGNRFLTREVIQQELGERNSGKPIKTHVTYDRQTQLIDALEKISNRERKCDELCRSSFESIVERCKRLVFFKYYRTQLRRSKGRFCLVHPDIMMQPSNILFNENMEIVAVIDWDGACVMPSEFQCAPPWPWLVGNARRMIQEPDSFNSLARQFMNQEGRNHALDSAMAIAAINPRYICDVFWLVMSFESRTQNRWRAWHLFACMVEAIRAINRTVETIVANSWRQTWMRAAHLKSRSYHEQHEIGII